MLSEWIQGQLVWLQIKGPKKSLTSNKGNEYDFIISVGTKMCLF